LAAKVNDVDDDLGLVDEEVVEQKAALEIESSVGGVIQYQKSGEAAVQLDTNDGMCLDKMGLVSPGAIYSSASYAAILAVNDPNGVCIGSDVKFLAPIESGNSIKFEAKALQNDTKKIEVKVIGEVLEIKVFEALFYIVIFEKHILRLKLSKKQKEMSTN